MLQQLGYIKQIDGLRAIAVLMVVVFHWFPKGWVTKSGLGLIGVDMFFVISGFLITRILLVYKSNQEAGFDYHSKWHILGRFMYRRALRIFPAYFLLLFVLHQTSYYLYNTLSNDWLWYVTYLQNFLFYIRQAWPDGKLSHFWTLAVEEQFYLIWPFLMLMFPAKRILIIICIFLLIGLISFHFLPFILEKKNMVDMITPSCLHAFSVGAIVAWCHISYPSWFEKTNPFLIFGLLFFFISLFARLYEISIVVDHRILVALASAFLIVYILECRKDFIMLYVLGSPFLVSLGKVSYGVYLYHNFIPVVLKGIMKWTNKNYPSFTNVPILKDVFISDTISFFVICFVILTLLAFFSFRFIEQPFLAFKNKVS